MELDGDSVTGILVITILMLGIISLGALITHGVSTAGIDGTVGAGATTIRFSPLLILTLGMPSTMATPIFTEEGIGMAMP